MNVSILTEKEVYQIAYLVHRGWEYDNIEKKWYKEGFLRDTFRLHICGCCRDEVKSPYFHLEDAYDAQHEHDAAKTG